MDFTDAKARLIASLESGDYRHEVRSSLRLKNLPASGDVTARYVAALVGACRGHQYRCGPHEAVADVEVHVFQPVSGPDVWYIKVFFDDDPITGEFTVVLSVHKSEFRRRRERL